MNGYRFALSRRWILAHLGVLLFAALCIVAGRWQLHRLAEKRAFNRTLQVRESEPPAALASLLDPAADARRAAARNAAQAIAYRRVTATGSYDAAHEIVLTGQTLGDRSGSHFLTPLVLGTGGAILVDRGWVPYTVSGQTIAGANPPPDTVTVTGVLLPSQRGFGTAVPAPAFHAEVSHVDLAKIATREPYRLAPLALRLQTQQPPQPAGLPTPVGVDKLDEGPHLSYTIQWFLFATIALVGYGFYLRKAAHDRARRKQPEPAVGATEPESLGALREDR